MERKLFESFYCREDWAVKEVYDRYARLIKHVSYQILNDNDLSDDIVNETFIRLLEKGELERPEMFVSILIALPHYFLPQRPRLHLKKHTYSFH